MVWSAKKTSWLVLMVYSGSLMLLSLDFLSYILLTGNEAQNQEENLFTSHPCHVLSRWSWSNLLTSISLPLAILYGFQPLEKEPIGTGMGNFLTWTFPTPMISLVWFLKIALFWSTYNTTSHFFFQFETLLSKYGELRIWDIRLNNRYQISPSAKSLYLSLNQFPHLSNEVLLIIIMIVVF